MINIVTAVVIAAATLTPASSLGWVCPTLDKNPTEAGVWQVLYEAAGRGYSSQSDGEAIATEIINNCPEYIPVVQEWADNN